MLPAFEPLWDRVVVAEDARPEKTPGGIFVPETAHQEPVKWGEVIAVGRGHLLEDGSVVPLGVKPGDRVAFNTHFTGGAKLSLPGFGQVYVMKEGDILGRVPRQT